MYGHIYTVHTYVVEHLYSICNCTLHPYLLGLCMLWTMVSVLILLYSSYVCTVLITTICISPLEFGRSWCNTAFVSDICHGFRTECVRPALLQQPAGMWTTYGITHIHDTSSSQLQFQGYQHALIVARWYFPLFFSCPACRLLDGNPLLWTDWLWSKGCC